MKKNKRRLSPFSIIIIFVCLLLLGLFMAPQLPVKLNPSKKQPLVSISFNMKGQSARVIEMEVTSKLEAMLNRIDGIQSLNSYSSNGSGYILIRLSEHINPDIVRFEISSIIRQTWPLLPKGVSYPSVSMSGTEEESDRPFIRYIINAPTSSILIQDYVENNIKTKLSGIKDISHIEVNGSYRMIYKLTYDFGQLQRYKISVNDIKSAIQLYLNQEFLGLGRIERENGQEEWISVALTSEMQNQTFDPSDIQVKNNEGTIISLSQLVYISFEEEEASSYFRINGLNSIYLSITADKAANQLLLSNQVQDLMKIIETSLPVGYEFHLSYNASEYIKTEINKIYFRSGTTILVLLCFILIIYRNLKYSFLIIISLITNIAIAAIFYYLLKIELQMFSLAGLTISLTLIIDNTIIISDQIVQRGNTKSFWAILTATITTIGALVIIFFMDASIRGKLLDFAWIIIINLIISLFIAILLVPALIEQLNIISKKKRSQNEEYCKLTSFIKGKKSLIAFHRVYKSVILFMYRKRIWFISIIVLAFGLPVFLLPEKIEMKENKITQEFEQKQTIGFWSDLYNDTFGSIFYKEIIKPVSDIILGGTMRLFVQKVQNGSYLSEGREETSLNVTASLPNGSTIFQMNSLIEKMENYIIGYPEVKQFETFVENGKRASIRIFFTKEYQRGQFPHILKQELISKALELGGGSWNVYGLGDGFNNDVKEQAGTSRIKLLGYSYDDLNALALVMKDSLLQHQRIKEVSIDSRFSWYKNDYEEFSFDLNKERLSQGNILPLELYHSLTPMFDRNIYVGDWINNEKIEPIFLYSKQVDELDIWNMENYPGKMRNTEYKLTDIADIEKGQVPQDIAKENQQYRLCLQYEYIGSPQQSRYVMEKTISTFNKVVPLGYQAESDLLGYWWNEEGNSQYWLLLLLIAIIFFTTSILFNSLSQPLIIIFIIPISFVGVFLVFYLFELNFDQGGFAAFILLSGISVNANIYILDEYNNIRKKWPGVTPIKAYIQAWDRKIRPIFLTIVSTILGFIPFMIGDYKEAFWFPLAAGTIGGLILSFIALFFFLPLFIGVGKKLN